MLFIFNLVLLTGTFSVILCTETLTTTSTSPPSLLTTAQPTIIESVTIDDTVKLNTTTLNNETSVEESESLPEALPYIRNEMPLLIIRPVPGNHLPTAQQINKNGGGFYISGPKGEDGEFPVKQFMSHFSDIINRMNHHQSPGGGGGGINSDTQHLKPIKISTGPSYIPHNHNPNYHSGTSIIRFTPPPSHSQSSVVVSPSNQHPKFIYSSDIHSIPSLNNLHAQQSHPVASVTRHHNHKSHQKPSHKYSSSPSYPITNNHGEFSKFTANHFRASQPIPLIDDTDLPKSSLFGPSSTSSQQRYHNYPKNGGGSSNHHGGGGGGGSSHKYHKDSHTSSSKYHGKKRPEKIVSFIELEDTDDEDSSYENSWSSRPSSVSSSGTSSHSQRYLNKKHSYNYSPTLHDLNQYQQQERISLYPETNPEYFQPNQNYQGSGNKLPKRSSSYQLKSHHTPSPPSPTTGTILVGSASSTLSTFPAVATNSNKKYVNYSGSVRVSDSSDNNYRNAPLSPSPSSSSLPSSSSKHDLMYEKLYSSFIQRNLLKKKKQSVEIIPSFNENLENTKIKPVNEYNSEENIQPTYSSRYSNNNKDKKQNPNSYQSVYHQVSSSIRAQDGPAIFITPIDFSTVSTISSDIDNQQHHESYVVATGPSSSSAGASPTASIIVQDNDPDVDDDDDGDDVNAAHATVDNPIESESTAIKTSSSINKHPFRKHTRIFRRKLNQSTLMGESCESTCLNNIVSRAYDPVCGSDNKSYANIGRLRCTKICGDHHLRISHFGNCDRTNNTLTTK